MIKLPILEPIINQYSESDFACGMLDRGINYVHVLCKNLLVILLILVTFIYYTFLRSNLCYTFKQNLE